MDLRKVLTASDRLYRLLLFACPKAFRDEYGPHMAQLFRDQCRDAYGQGGIMRLVWLWFPAFFDLTKTALAEHIWEVSHMNRKNITNPERLAILTPLLIFLMIFIINPGYVGQLFVREEPFIIVPFLPCGWFIPFLAAGFILAGYYFFGVAHGITVQFRNDVVRMLATLMLLLANMLILLGPAALQVIRAI